MTQPIAISLMLSGLILATLVVPRLSQRHTLVLALFASAVLSLGSATLLGYALDLNSVYLWGFDTATSPFAATAISLVGIAILARAWREHTLAEVGAPSWLPLPVVVGSATLTVIFYLGLQEQEIVRLHEATRRSAYNLSRSLETVMRTQSEELYRFGREWSDPDKTAVVRGVEAESFLKENPGGQVIALVSPDAKHVSLETYPFLGNEHLTGLVHSNEPARVAAIVRALAPPRGPSISSTIDVHAYGSGYAIYVPLEQNNRLWGFLATDFAYSRVIERLIERDATLRTDYLTRVSITGTPIFDNSGFLGSMDDVLDQRGGVDVVETIFDRRMRFTMVSTDEAFVRDRRNVPERSPSPPASSSPCCSA
ncbi:MAG: hypothetical protein J6386_22900 [Candidatus Synoicihabitans palmerolidicus]|nr:hypothetical protein [Candidatus Synoicihabitans palmerolidicus]